MKNTKNTINTQTQLLNFFNNHSTLSLVKNESNFKSKTEKEKLLYSIEKEIKILSNRDSLELVLLSKKGDIYTNKNKETKTYLNDRYENRFWKNSNSDTITFNLKYKGKIIPIVEGESIECNNSVDSLIMSLNQIKTQIELLDNSDILFSNIK
tara:strand:+ start:934 stop:1392 length:459 start_codon:yes stop_codon:yes gene_type:complete